MQNALIGKRILITQATAFAGPSLFIVFELQQAHVVRSDHSLHHAVSVNAVVSDAGATDVLVAKVSILAPSTTAIEVEESEWVSVFAALADPLPRLIKVAVPGMISRSDGKVLAQAALCGMQWL